MLSILISLILQGLAWGPRVTLDLFRRWRLGRRGVIEIEIDEPLGSSLTSAAGARQALATMAEDDTLRGVLVRLKAAPGGWATLGQLRDALAGLRDAGKLVVVHLEQAGLKELYLASVADRVWLTPSAELLLSNVGGHLQFYGDLLERVGVQADMVAAGDFKSFGEPYTRAWPSRPNREQVQALVTDLQDQLVSAIASSREVSPQVVEDLLQASPVPAEVAREAGVVDGLAYADQVRSHVEELLGAGVRDMPLGLYAFLVRWRDWLARLGTRAPRFAVLHLEGPIVTDSMGVGGSAPRIDSDRAVPLIDRLAEIDQIKGVILHVRSPGGSALASDLIARAVRRLGDRKPVVAVFDDVAASGGFYLSAPAAEIVARPDSITGSIGVVGGKLVLGEALSRIGVHGESISAGDDVGMFQPWAPFTPSQRERFKASLQRTYDRFIQVVAAGRKQPAAAVEQHARGRVWTGRQAHEVGLVDHLGGLEVGIERLELLTGVRGHRTVHVKLPPPRLRLLARLLGRADARAFMEEFVAGSTGPTGVLVASLRQRPGEALALMPWDLR